MKKVDILKLLEEKQRGMKEIDKKFERMKKEEIRDTDKAIREAEQEIARLKKYKKKVEGW